MTMKKNVLLRISNSEKETAQMNALGKTPPGLIQQQAMTNSTGSHPLSFSLNFFLFLFLFLGLIGTGRSETINLTGTVKHAITGAGIADHAIFITSPQLIDSIYTVTDSEGVFSSEISFTDDSLIIWTYTADPCNQKWLSALSFTNDPSTLNIQFLVCDTLNSEPCNALYYDSISYKTVYFFNHSTGQFNRSLWNFGDGQQSEALNPVHTYGADGNYTVSLQIEGDQCQSYYSSIITIGNGYIDTTIQDPGCEANFYYYADSVFDKNQMTNFPVHFFNTSKGKNLTWSWNFGDGSTSHAKDPIHFYSASGTYSVTLTINGENCTASRTIEITVENFGTDHGGTKIECQAYLSSLNFFDSVQSEANPVPLDVYFFNQSKGTFENSYWEFGDGQSSGESNPVHTYNSPGNYTVTLTISGTDCQSSFTYDLSISDTKETEIKTNESEYNFTGTDQFSAYPNPVDKLSTLIFSSSADQKLSIITADAKGNIIEKVGKSCQKGMNRYTLDLSGYPSGMYILQVISGNQEKSIHIIKK